MEGYHYIKRGIDIILSGMAIVILSPLRPYKSCPDTSKSAYAS